MTAPSGPSTAPATTLSAPLLLPLLNRTKQTVLTHMPRFWQRFEANFSVASALRLQHLDVCLTLFTTGPSGAGKSAVNNCFEGATGVVRVDSLTAASFASCASNFTGAQLFKEIDLLPQIQHKLMVTRDLSTVFRKNSDQLKDLFGVLVPVLDGQGYAPHAGTQGLRSVTGNYIFGWVGASTPFPPQTWDAQKRFGSRLLTYDVFAPKRTDEEIFAERAGEPFAKKIAACRDVSTLLLEAIHRRRADGVTGDAARTVPWRDDPKDISLWRIKLALLLVATRVHVVNIPDQQGDEEDDPHRIVSQLEGLTRGRAMLYDRTVVTEEDLPLAVHTVLSSSRHGLVLRAVAENPNGLTVKTCAERYSWSEQTATNRMEAFVKRTDERVVRWEYVGGLKALVPSKDFSWIGDLKARAWL